MLSGNGTGSNITSPSSKGLKVSVNGEGLNPTSPTSKSSNDSSPVLQQPSKSSDFSKGTSSLQQTADDSGNGDDDFSRAMAKLEAEFFFKRSPLKDVAPSAKATLTTITNEIRTKILDLHSKGKNEKQIVHHYSVVESGVTEEQVLEVIQGRGGPTQRASSPPVQVQKAASPARAGPERGEDPKDGRPEVKFAAATPAKRTAASPPPQRPSAPTQTITPQSGGAVVSPFPEHITSKVLELHHKGKQAKGIVAHFSLKEAALDEVEVEEYLRRYQLCCLAEDDEDTDGASAVTVTAAAAVVKSSSEGDLRADGRAEDSAARDEADRSRAEAEDRLRREVEDSVRRDLEDRVRREVEDKVRREVEERLRSEVEEKVRREYEDRMQREAAERARKDAEERQHREAEDAKRREAEERARREAEARWREEAARVERETRERVRQETEDRVRRELEDKALREAEERKRQEAEAREVEDRVRREAEDRARREPDEPPRVAHGASHKSKERAAAPPSSAVDAIDGQAQARVKAGTASTAAGDQAAVAKPRGVLSWAAIAAAGAAAVGMVVAGLGYLAP